MKRIFTLGTFLFFISWVANSQSLVSITQNTADRGETFTATIIGSATTWTFATPTAQLYFGIGDTIDATLVTVVDDVTVTADFNISCAATLGSYGLKTYDPYSFALTLASSFTVNGMTDAPVTITDESCFGSCDGSITVNSVTGGVAPYSYSWYNDAGLTSLIGTGTSITGLCAGTYYLEVTDNNSCTYVGTHTIASPPDITVTGVNTDLLCFGDASGSIDITASGGVPGYVYTWIGPNSFTATTEDVTGLEAGTYDVTVTDANGCNVTYNATLSEPTMLTGSTVFNDPFCNSQCDGDATVTPGGGTPPYVYSWDDPSFQTTATASSLCAGTYNVVVTDNNGCTYVDVVTLTDPDELLVNIDWVINPMCNGVCDGESGGSAIGGSSNYIDFSWSPVPGGGQGTANVNGLCASTYTLTVTDDNGCVGTASATLIEPTPLTIIPSQTDPTCFGAADGFIDLTASGGTSPYQYSIDNGVTFQGSTSFTGLTAGTYNVVVEDANGCQTTSNVTLTEPTQMTISTTSTDVTCFGVCDGSADAIVSGGTGGYTYDWFDGATTVGTTQSMSNLCAGTYTITVTDANGCVENSVVTISEPTPITTTTSQVDPSCFGGCDGQGELSSVSGGTVPYSYSWDDPSFQTSATAIGLCAGTYNVVVTDDNGCTNVDVVTLVDPTAIAVSSTVTDASCMGCSDGDITISATGGAGGFNYSIDDGTSFQATTSFVGLTSGTYIIHVVDANGCVGYDTVNVQEPTGIQAGLTVVDPSCNPGCDGQATANPSTGTAPYSYSWSNGETTQTATALCVGSVSLTITDNLGATFDTTFVLIDPSNGLAVDDASVSIVDALCSSANGSITGMSVSGGTTPYTYDYNGTTSATIDLTTAQPGTYVFTVTDANGCTASSGGVAVNAVNSTLTNSINVVDATCVGNCDGAIDVTTTGGTAPYSYTWSNGMTGANLTGVCAGTKTVTVVDANGCELVESTTVNEPTPMATTVNSTVPTCGDNNGELTINNTSGGTAPYTYQWSNGDFGATADSLLAGVYSLTTTDANGCVSQQVLSLTSASAPAVSVNSTSPTCNGSTNGSIDITVTGGTAPITFDWSTGHATEDISNIPAGIYDVIIEDASGCQIVEIITLADATPIDLSSFTSSPASCSANDGALAVSVSGGAGGYNYLWSTGGTSSIETGLSAGSYTLSVSDANGCLAMNTYTVSNAGGPVINVDQVIQPTCQGGTGEIHVSVTGGTTPYVYQWNNGETTSSLYNAPVGEYELIVTDASGCQGVNYAELEGINLNAAEICMVTVDSITGGNYVVWNKEFNLGISEYEVYKETSVLNVFQQIGSVPFDSLSQFIDTAANSNIHSYRYKLRTVDSCGNASEFLAIHKTIHLSSNIGLGGVVNLAWDDYIGFAYTTFYINRYHPSTGWELIDSVAANVHSYTDANHPGFNNLQYSIEVRPSSPCVAEKAQDHNTTRSNNAAIMGDISIFVDENLNNSVAIYPNPTTEWLNVHFSNEMGEVKLKIHDLNGKQLKSFILNGQSLTLDIKDLNRGVYLMKIDSELGTYASKIIKL